MQKRLSKVAATVGVAVGVVAIGGSIAGGLLLAADRGREQAPSTGDSTVNVSNDGRNGVTSSTGASQPATDPTTSAGSGTTRSAGAPATTPGAGRTTGTATVPTSSPTTGTGSSPTASPSTTCPPREDDC